MSIWIYSWNKHWNNKRTNNECTEDERVTGSVDGTKRMFEKNDSIFESVVEGELEGGGGEPKKKGKGRIYIDHESDVEA